MKVNGGGKNWGVVQICTTPFLLYKVYDRSEWFFHSISRTSRLHDTV